MDPLTLLTIGSIIWKGVSSVLGGNAAKSANDYNARVAEIQAQDALQRGKEDEALYRLGVKSLMGSQTADFAGQNVDVTSGTAVDVRADTAYLGELDAQTIRRNAQREAWGYSVQAQQSRQAGRQAQRSGYFDAAASVLGGSASLLQAKYGWGRGNA